VRRDYDPSRSNGGPSESSSHEPGRRVDRLWTLARLASSVSSALELETVLAEVTAALMALRPDVVCAVRLIDEEAGGYRLAGTGGFPGDRRVQVVPFGDGLTHVVAQTRRPVLVADNQADPRALKRHWSASQGLTTYYGVPIEAGPELFGVINVNFPPAAPPTDEEQATVAMLAGQAAVAIRNARLFAESEGRRRAAESLAEVSRSLARTLDVDTIVQQIADMACQLLQARSALVFRQGPDPEDLVTVALAGIPRDGDGLGVVFSGTGLAGYVVRQRQAAVTPDVLADPRVLVAAEDRLRIACAPDRAVLAVPLIAHDRVIGALAIRDSTGRTFRAEERWLAQAFADQAAVAFENARLYTEGAHRRLAAEELSRIARTLTESLDVTTVADRIVESVLPLLGIHSSVLRRLEPDGALVALAVGGRAAQHIERGHRIPPGVGVVGRALLERRPVVREVQNEASVILNDDVRDRMAASSMGVVLAVPLMTQDEALGVLAVGDVAGRRFSTESMTVLQAFADHATLALQNARLYQEVREARDFLQLIAENSADGIVTTDTRGRITSVSRGAEAIFGCRAVAMLGRRIAEHYEGGLDEGRQIMHRLSVEQRITEYETSLRRDDGHWTPTSASMALLRDANDVVTGTLGIFRNITERKHGEQALRQSEEQIRQLQKLEAIGKLAGGVAHDFNNLLTVIIGRCELMVSQLSLESALRRDIDLVHTTAERAAALTRQLLAFSRKQILEPKVLEPNSVVSGLASMLKRLIGEDIDFAYHPGDAVGRVKVDPGQLEQMIVNLVVNARDAMPQGGCITIETASVELAEPYAHDQHELPPGAYVMLGISDTGVGMDAATRARIFEPFFTTKPIGEGTGLGLSTVYGVVKQSGGGISVYSEPGEGTVFKVYLPRVDEEPVRQYAAPGSPRTSSGSETILVVEDQAEVRDFVRDGLVQYGYRVLDARTPAEALQILERHQGVIHLLVTDVVMPQMSGRELAERLTAREPTLKVLYMSGYTESAIVRHGRLDAGTVLLQKPFAPDALADKVRTVLDASDGS
jgi:PAS domain S-box-containing protein